MLYPRITRNRRLLTLTTGLNHEFKFVYATVIATNKIGFDDFKGEFQAHIKRDATVWELQRYGTLSRGSFTKMAVLTTADSVELA